MKPAPFWYHRPTSRPEVDEILAATGPEATPLAGGQWLVPALARRLVRPGHVVDLNHLRGEPSDAEVTDAHATDPDATGTVVRIGPLVRLAALERDPALRDRLPVLSELLGSVANRPVRARATAIGNIMCGDPAAALPALALLLDSTLDFRDAGGRRRVPLAEALTGMPGQRSAGPGWVEQLALTIPADGTALAVDEVSVRHAGRAILGAVVSARYRVGGLAVSLALYGLAVRQLRWDLPVLPDAKAVTEAIRQWWASERWTGRVTDDVHADAAYRCALIPELTLRCAATAITRLCGETP